MSKADKSANRSAMKARAFNPRSGPIVRKVAPPSSSWWIDGAASDSQEKFIALAHERDRSAWRGVVPHAMHPRGEFR